MVPSPGTGVSETEGSDKHTCNGAQGLETLQISDNDVPVDHALRPGRHRDRKHDNQRRRNHRHTSRDGVDDDLLLRAELVRGQHDNGAHDGDEEQDESKPRELSLKRGTNSEAEEAGKGVPHREEGGDAVAANVGGAVLLSLDGSPAGLLPSERGGNLADLGKHAGSKHDAAGSSLCHGGRAIRNVEAVTGSRVILVGRLGLLANRERLSSKQRLIGLKVDAFDETDISRDGVAGFEIDHVTGDDCHGRNDHGLAVPHSARGWGAERAE